MIKQVLILIVFLTQQKLVWNVAKLRRWDSFPESLNILYTNKYVLIWFYLDSFWKKCSASLIFHTDGPMWFFIYMNICLEAILAGKENKIIVLDKTLDIKVNIYHYSKCSKVWNSLTHTCLFVCNWRDCTVKTGSDRGT